VLTERNFTHQEIAQRVGSNDIRDRAGTHDVAARFAHLALFDENPAVGKNLSWQRQFGGHQKCGPVDGMETQDVLANEVQVSGPEVGAFHRAHISGERIEPYIKDMVALDGNRNAPLDVGPSDGKVVEAAFDKLDQL